MKKKTLRQIVEQIMQDGFDVAMGGDPFKSEEENKQLQEEKYDEVVKKNVKLLKQREAEVREKIIEKLPRVKYYEYSTDHNDGYTEGQEEYRNSIIQSLNQNKK